MNFLQKNWSLSGLNRLLKNITESGNGERKTGSGRPRTATTNEAIEAIEELVMSQEDKPGTHRSICQIC